VGLLVSELHGSFFGDMMSSIESMLRDAGKHVVITAGHSEAEKEKQAIEFLISRRCDALILNAEAVSEEYLKSLLDNNIEIILINRNLESLQERCIVLDNQLGGYLATKAAIEQGHRNIAYISGPHFKEDAQQRLAGHKQALEEAGIPFDSSLCFEGGYHESEGQDGFNTLFKQNDSFTALICANDEMASGAMTAAREHGLSIPNDLSIIGFDNVLFARYLYPKLTTVDNPIAKMGEMAANWVLSNIYNTKTSTPINHLFKPELIIRDSLGALHAD
jgi:LacI family transcriptional regulator